MLSHTMHEAAKAPDGRSSGEPVRYASSDTVELGLNDPVTLLAECGLTDEQARELSAVLDTIARGFVEYAWSGEVCGQLLDGFQAVLSNAVQSLDFPDSNQERESERAL